MNRSVAVLGAGHGGLTAAADLTLKGHEVRLFSRTSDALGVVQSAGGITLTGAAGEGFARISMVTTDLEKAISGADLICLVVPTTAHADYARRLAPILADGQPVFLNPGHTGGGLQFVTELRRNGYRGEVMCCESSTLTYGCRIQPSGEVHVWSVVPALPFAAFPGKHAKELFALVREFYPSVRLRKNVLESGFANLNAVEHPPQALLNVGWLEHTQGDYLFYYEGTTPSVGRVIDAVDRERLAVARAMGVESRPFVDAFFDAGYTTEHALKVGTAYQALHESAPNRWVKGPRSLDHRYVHEDVGHGLVPWAAWGDLVDVDTPTMDSLIEIASVVNGRDYACTGLTLHKMGLEGVDRNHLEAFLREGQSDGS